VTICAPVLSTDASPRRSSERGKAYFHALAITFALASLALLAAQLRDANLGRTLGTLQPGYLVLALGWTVVSMLAACYNLLGFTPARLKLAPTFLVQLATSGLRIIAPSAVSTPAVATRYLVRSGVRMPDALASVGAAQTAQLVVTTLIVTVLGVTSGDAVGLGHVSATSVLFGALLLALLSTVLTGLARSYERVRNVGTQIRGSIAMLVEHARRRPAMVGLGVFASGALTAAHILAFAACVSAVGGHASVLALTTIYLAAAAAGSIVPTPGGLGAVEAALIAGLTASGVALPAATAAALLSRLVAVWLPAVPGWLAVIALRRRGLL
jgi:uncharacterized protein (TIRG00374 family)